MKKSKKIISMILLVTMVLSTACGKETSTNTGDDVITLTIFDKNTGDAFTDAVAEEITRRTGIKLEVQQPTGDPEEKLNLMLASGDLPDIVLMDRRSTIVNRYIAGGALIPLNDLIDEYGADIQAMYGDTLNKSRYSDGLNYYLNNWYGIDPNPDRGVNMRMDVLEEFGYGEKAQKGEVFTQEEFLDIMRKYKDTYTDENGQSAIPYTVNSEYTSGEISGFKGMYGLKNYYEVDSNLQFEVRDPQYLEMVRFINQMYREGLLDKEWAVNKESTFNQKASSGRVFATGGGNPNDVNQILRADYGEDTNKQFYMFRVVADGVNPNETTFSPRSSLGWDAIGITTANEHPEETIKLFNFLASEEGQYLLMWGVEGKDWDMVDGVHTPKEEVLQGFKEDWGNFAKETGIRKWTWFIKNGNGSDGTPYDLAVNYEKDAIAAHSVTSMVNSIWDTAYYDNLGPEGGTTEALQEQKIKDIINKAFSNMVYSESEEELERLYQALIEELDANGAETIEKIYTENYQERLSLWE